MATTATVRPPPPPNNRPPPPPPPNKRKQPPPPKTPPKKPPPHPPPRTTTLVPSPPKRPRRSSVSIDAPVVLRDVNVFTKKQQVGQGTYGSVFVGQDNRTGEIVALKRINTEQEENGFPITAIREVKILKALDHVNIVALREIVTSKGKNRRYSLFAHDSFYSWSCLCSFLPPKVKRETITEAMFAWSVRHKICATDDVVSLVCVLCFQFKVRFPRMYSWSLSISSTT